MKTSYLRRYIISILLFILVLAFDWTTGMANPDLNPADDWQTIRPGIEYRKFHLTDPRSVNLFVARMDRQNLNVTLESSIAKGQLVSGLETVEGMAWRYDQAINYWDNSWGSRNDVAVAINGFYFDLATGLPRSGQVHSGWYAKRFWDHESGSGFAWTLNRTAHIGQCVEHKPKDQYLTFPGGTKKIHDINVPTEDDTLILYTPQYGPNSGTGDDVLEYLVEMKKPTLILPEPAMAIGYVREIRDRVGSTPIPFDHVVLSASGAVRGTLLGDIQVGDEVGITQEIRDCTSVPKQNWTKTYASIGGDYYFLEDGVVRTDFTNPDADIANSRTAIAYNDDYIYFIVVDAFEPDVSEGMKIPELGVFARDVLQARYAIAQDSGGSSTMVVDGEVVNNTHCNFTRGCDPENQAGQRMAGDSGPEQMVSPDGFLAQRVNGLLQPLVANGMMMVSVPPMVKSNTFTPGEIVVTVTEAELLLGPGINYASIGTIPPLTAGDVVSHMNNLEGVLAKESFWWKVDFAGDVGWVREETLLNGKLPNDFQHKQAYLPFVGQVFQSVAASQGSGESSNR